MLRDDATGRIIVWEEKREMKVFKDYAYYYNMFYEDKNYREEAETVNKFLKKYESCETNSILNLGCGTGKHDIELCKLGYCVDGIDFSPNMIEIARKNNQQSNYTVADIRNYRINKIYDAVLSLFHVISYQNTNQDLLDSFVTANNALRKGGGIYF